jgi:hypothetical protein
MAYRVNERNIGDYSLDGERKIRKTKQVKHELTETEKAFAQDVLTVIYQGTQKQKNGEYKVGVTFEFSEEHLDLLSEIISKLG